MFQDTVKSRLRELVDATGLSEAECAKQIGISYSTFSKIYNQGKLTRFCVGKIIVDYFNITYDYILGLSDGKDVSLRRAHKEAK